MSVSFSKRWCGDTSAVTLIPARFASRMMRTDSLMLGGFKVAQIVSVIMIIIGLLIIMITGRKGRYEDLYNQDRTETIHF